MRIKVIAIKFILCLDILKLIFNTNAQALKQKLFADLGRVIHTQNKSDIFTNIDLSKLHFRSGIYLTYLIRNINKINSKLLTAQ